MPSWLVRQLRSIEGLDAELDGDVLQLSMSGSSPISFAVEEKSRLSMEGARALVNMAGSASQRLLVATRKLSDEARSVLKAHGISWVERETRACRIQGPGILIDRSPREAQQKTDSSAETRPATKLGDKAGVIAETLLLFFQQKEIRVRSLARESGTSQGYVSRVLNRLEDEGILAGEGVHAHKRRQIIDSAGLLDLWRDEEKVERWAKHRLYVWAQTTEALYTRLNELTTANFEWALGHTSAANRYTPTLTRQPDPEIWISAEIPVEQVGAALEGEVVESGSNLTVWQCSGDSPLYHAGPVDSPHNHQHPIVSRYRAYVEAYHRGGRSEEVATRLRENLDLSESRTSQ